MSIRAIAFLFIIGVAVLAFVAWPKKQAAPPAPAPQAGGDTNARAPGMPGADAGGGTESADPGVTWTVPPRWTTQGERPMRLATYSVPAVPGDAEGGECAVFYFGPNQGGGVEANIDRWVGQFEGADTPARSTQTVHGLAVSRVKLHGTYLAPGGPNMESQGKKLGYELLGAIVGGPKGAVFFKLTGPTKTVDHAAPEFDHLIASLK